MVHNGHDGDLNDNALFCGMLEDIVKFASRVERYEEFFHQLLEIYLFDDGSYGMYFTHPLGGSFSEIVNGYLLMADDLTNLFQFFATVKQVDFNCAYVQEFVQYAKEDGFIAP